MATTFVTVFIFYTALKNATVDAVKRKSNAILGVILVWFIVQAALALNGFYKDIHITAQKMLMIGLPPLGTIALLFLTKNGRKFIDSVLLQTLTWLHTIRVPVEIVLLLLFVHRAIPQLMTFEGRNFDIIAGITAPVIAWYGFKKINLGVLFSLPGI